MCHLFLPFNIQSTSFIDGSSSHGCFKILSGSLGPQCCAAAKCCCLSLLFCQVVPLPGYMYIFHTSIVTTIWTMPQHLVVVCSVTLFGISWFRRLSSVLRFFALKKKNMRRRLSFGVVRECAGPLWVSWLCLCKETERTGWSGIDDGVFPSESTAGMAYYSQQRLIC